jgi:Na+/H+ antiporter NhaD/arsenite permease-like protein
MLHIILAATALAFVAALPRSWTAAAAAAVCAALALAAGEASPAMAQAAVSDALPPVVFLASVIGLAMLADRSGLAERLAAALARVAGGSTPALFLWVCGACAVLTATLSLDGAVVVMLPVLAALRRTHGAPLRPLLLATVGVANSFSAALPAGNPTNLVVMERLGLSPERFIGRMLLPSLGATLACTAILWAFERRALRGSYVQGVPRRRDAGRRDLPAVGALAAAAVADWVSPVLGAAPGCRWHASRPWRSCSHGSARCSRCRCEPACRSCRCSWSSRHSPRGSASAVSGHTVRR